MKRLLITLSLSLVFAGCGSSLMATAEPSQLNIETTKKQSILSVSHKVPAALKSVEVIQQENLALTKLATYNKKMTSAVNKLKKYVGWDYGYGETPGAWDCSGLVRWFYLQQGVSLYHSATAEFQSGRVVTTPLVGDVVAFHYYGSGDYSFHVGIYIGNGKVLHAYNEYAGTVIGDVEQVARENNSYATYTRIIERPTIP